MSARCFVGIELPAELADALVCSCERLRRGAPQWRDEKWVRAENLHVTALFIGPVDESRLTALAEAVRVAADASPPFELVFERLSALPSPRRARMLWARFGDVTGDAAALASRLGSAAASFAPPTAARDARPRPYTAHVTLCRARSSRAISDVVLGDAEASLPDSVRSMSVVSATLFRSRLTPRGPAYERLALCHLRGSGRSAR